MTEALRAQVRERARRRCEYCLYPDLIRSGPFAIEHIQPRSAGAEATTWTILLGRAITATATKLPPLKLLILSLEHLLCSTIRVRIAGQITSFGRRIKSR